MGKRIRFQPTLWIPPAPPDVLRSISGTSAGTSADSAGLAVSTVELTILPISGSGSRLMNGGVPLPVGFHPDAGDLDNVTLWGNRGSGHEELSCHLLVLAQHLDDSVKSLRVQFTGDPDDFDGPLELRFNVPFSVARASATTAPAVPAVALIASAEQMQASGWLPWEVTPWSSFHADFTTGYGIAFGQAMHYCNGNDPLRTTHSKYGRTTANFYWLIQRGPGVTNAATFFSSACTVAQNNHNDDPLGEAPPHGNVDTLGAALHYLFTGWTGSRTRVGKYAVRYGLHGFGSNDWYPPFGGRGAHHTVEAITQAILLDIDDVDVPGASAGPYTREQHLDNLVSLITQWLAGFASGEMSLPVPVDGFHNQAGSGARQAEVLIYMNAQMHGSVHRAFDVLEGLDAGLDALREDWNAARDNFCDHLLNEWGGIDDATDDQHRWPYAGYYFDGVSAVWGSGFWTEVAGTAELGTDANTVVDTGVFTTAAVGDVVLNTTRNAWAKIQTKTSNNSVELDRNITGQTTGDSFVVFTDAWPNQSWTSIGGPNPGTWFQPFINLVFFQAGGAYKAVARAWLVSNLAWWATPGTTSWGEGSYSSANFDTNYPSGFCGGQGLAGFAPWMAEAA